jgi:hypothetical protein
MPSRPIEIEGRTWEVFPSGFLTPNTMDEFGLLFVHGSGDIAEVRVTRYAPTGVKSREQALAALSDVDLHRLFRASQPSEFSPEAGYRS